MLRTFASLALAALATCAIMAVGKASGADGITDRSWIGRFVVEFFMIGIVAVMLFLFAALAVLAYWAVGGRP